MFSQTAEYALRAVVELAGRDGVPLTTDELARATQVPSGYLAKVMQSLGRAGLVHAQRGKRGGFTLARPADAVSLLDVLAAVDPIQRIRSCPLKLPGHRLRLCPLHARLDAALARIEREFADTPISSLLESESALPALCGIQEAACV